MSIAVIGTSIIDQMIEASSMIPGACNKSQIKTTFGGSMRNIAENLSYLGESVLFATNLSSDILGTALKSHLEQLDVTVIANIVNLPSPFFTSIYHDHETFRFASVNDAFHITNTSQIPADQLSCAAYGITEISSYPLLSYLLTHTPATSWLLSANFLDDLNFQTLYSSLFGIVMNEEEASYLSPNMTYLQLAHSLLEQGMKRIIVTLSDQGVYYLDEMEELHLPAIAVSKPHYTIGCGDALIAAYLHAIHHDTPARQALQQGLLAASIKLTQIEAVTSKIAQIKNNL